MQPGLLIILDGFGFGDETHPCNAVALAQTPCLDRLRQETSWIEIDNNQHHVGLPEGQMGNSEVGHLNIGAGRIIYQDFLKINKAIEAGNFGTNPAYQQAFEFARSRGGSVHIVGLLGPGGVHAHEDHFQAILQACQQAGVAAKVHPITDGRDTQPRSAEAFMATLQQQCDAAAATIVDVVGRYWAMDRDNNWDRIQQAYQLYRDGASTRSAGSAADALQAAYLANEDDEFLSPTRIADGTIQDGDAVIWLNFRPDRSRQMTRAFKQPDFVGFGRDSPDVYWVCTTQYDDEFLQYPQLAIAWPPARPSNTLGEHIASLGLKQLRIAETEKYAHVTYFLNGGREQPYEGEERILVPSPKVATYDLQPEMHAGEVTDHLLHALGSSDFDLLVVNFANPDMIGHTGNLQAGIEMMEFMDNCLHRLTAVATELGYVTVITSDHGNCEEMCQCNPDGSAGGRVTSHSMGPSPFMVVGKAVKLRSGGALCNVAPTLLELMGLPVPPEMDAGSLLLS